MRVREPSHQAIQFNLLAALRDAVKLIDGEYITEGLTIRGRDFQAVDTINPFPLKLTWEQLNDGL